MAGGGCRAAPFGDGAAAPGRDGDTALPVSRSRSPDREPRERGASPPDRAGSQRSRGLRCREGLTPLGAVPYPRFPETHFDIGPDCTLLLFTDGIVEQHGENVEVRLEELRRSVEAAPTAPDALCDFVLQRMLARPERQD